MLELRTTWLKYTSQRKRQRRGEDNNWIDAVLLHADAFLSVFYCK